MPSVTTTSESGFASESEIREFAWDIDPSGEDAPDTLEALIAAYAACFVPALRVGAEQRNVGELGRVEIDATGDLNDDDKLAAIAFDIKVAADVSQEDAERAVDRAEDLCKVHDAVKQQLKASMSITPNAF